MSDRALQFLTDWKARHIRPIPYVQHESHGRRLATLCLAEAALHGISETELENELDQDLVSDLIDALEDRVDREIFRTPAEALR